MSRRPKTRQKGMKTVNIVEMRRKYYVQLLKRKRCTISELKVEVLLTVCHNLLLQYRESEDSGRSVELVELVEQLDKDQIGESKFIYSWADKCISELTGRIVSGKRLDQILAESSKDAKANMLSLELGSILYFRDILGAQFKRSLDTNENVKEWCPELLVMKLIATYRDDLQYSFKRFPFFHDYNFERLETIYNKTNILIKKMDGLVPAHKRLEKTDKKVFTSRVKTPINFMEEMAYDMCIALDKAVYAR